MFRLEQHLFLVQTAQLTSGSTALLEKLVVTELVKFRAFYTTQRLITISTGVHKSKKTDCCNNITSSFNIIKCRIPKSK